MNKPILPSIIKFSKMIQTHLLSVVIIPTSNTSAVDDSYNDINVYIVLFTHQCPGETGSF